METYQKILARYGLEDPWCYHETAFSRNLGLINGNELEALSRTTVAIAGLGGVGGSHLITLARCGIGGFNLAEFDSYEPANINRQYGAQVPGFGRPKMDVMVEHAYAINPHLEISTFPVGINNQNIDNFLCGASVVLDGIDFFAFDARRLLFNRALELKVPVITAGPLGFSAALLVFMPGGMGFDDYFSISPEMSDKIKVLHFATGLTPRPTHTRYIDMNFVNLEKERGPSFAPAIQLCASLATTEAIRIILSRGKIFAVPYYLVFDPYLRKFRTGRLRKGNDSWLQRLKMNFIEHSLGRITRIGAEKPDMPEAIGVVNDETKRYIIRAGIQAPSGDNIQPWRFSSNRDSVDLYLDRSADSCFFNVRQVASTIACGAAVRNMVVAGKALALSGKVELVPDASQPDLMARVHFEPMEYPHDEILEDAIWKRCTNRKMYSKKAVSNGVWQRIAKRVKAYPGAKLHWVSEREQLKSIAKIVARVDRIRTENKNLHMHFMNMTRFSECDAVATGDGLPLKNLEAGVLGELFLKSTRKWTVMAAANALGIGKIVANHSAQGILSSGGVGLISVANDGVADFLRGGQALQEAWLHFAHLGIQFQPMATVALFRMRWIWEGDESFTQVQRKFLQSSWLEMNDMFPRFISRYPVLMFRVGFAPPIRYGTFRKPLEDFIES